MPILYVDNFRGFSDTYIPLTDVNFFMGENSTGKSSVLSLFNLLNDTGFWLSQDFNSEEIRLGSFSEIADTNKDFFKIGVFDLNNSSTKNEDSYKSILMKFKNEKGAPSLSEFSYITKGHSVVVNIGKKSIKYTVRNVSTIPEDHSQVLVFFKNWIQDVDTSIKSKGYNIIKISSNDRMPIPIIWSIIETELDTKKKNETKSSNKGLSTFDARAAIPSFFGKLCWVAPIRAKPKRTYDNYGIYPSSEGHHAPYILNRILSFSNKSNYKKEVLSSLESFGLQSRLFESIKTFPFGKDETSPFELDVILNSKKYKISNVGYGVSQILPIIVEMLSRTKNTWYAIQQPEVHLHPRAQAALGEFIYNIHLSENKCFVIETHSEYLIDRFRININKNQDKKVNSQVLFFERTANGNTVKPIEIDGKGRYSEDQPTAFMDFFIKEEIELLEVC